MSESGTWGTFDKIRADLGWITPEMKEAMTIEGYTDDSPECVITIDQQEFARRGKRVRIVWEGK